MLGGCVCLSEEIVLLVAVPHPPYEVVHFAEVRAFGDAVVVTIPPAFHLISVLHDLFGLLHGVELYGQLRAVLLFDIH